MPRRERWAIIGAILTGIELETQQGARARTTRVAAHANLPFDRLRTYLDELAAAGLLADDPPTLTPKGREFLVEYRRWSRVLGAFGLDEE